MSNYASNTTKQKRIIRRSSFLDICTLMLLFVLMLVSVYPKLTATGGTTVLSLLIEVLLVGIAVLQNVKVFTKLIINNAMGIFFMIYTFFMPYLFGNSVISHRYSAMFMLVLGVILFEFYSATNRLIIVRRAIVLSLPFLAVTFVRTFRIAMTDPSVIRSIKYNTDTAELLADGIGGYEFIYMLSLIAAFFFICFLKEKKIHKKLLFLAGTALVFALLILANYMTAFLLAVISVFLAVVISGCEDIKKEKSAKSVVYMITIIILLSVLLINQRALVDLFSYITHDDGRLQKVFNTDKSVFAAVKDEFIADRYYTLKSSWNAFLEHPIMGLISEQLFIAGEKLKGFGQHSYVLDTFALYGGFIGLIGTIQLFKPYSRYKEYKKNATFRYVLCIHFVLLAFLNNLNFSTIFLSTVVLPCMVDYFTEKKEKKENKNEKEKNVTYG